MDPLGRVEFTNGIVSRALAAIRRKSLTKARRSVFRTMATQPRPASKHFNANTEPDQTADAHTGHYNETVRVPIAKIDNILSTTTLFPNFFSLTEGGSEGNRTHQ